MRNYDTEAEGNSANTNFATLTNIRAINPPITTTKGDVDGTQGTNNYI
jgi:hypothetical protein